MWLKKITHVILLCGGWRLFSWYFILWNPTVSLTPLAVGTISEQKWALNSSKEKGAGGDGLQSGGVEVLGVLTLNYWQEFSSPKLYYGQSHSFIVLINDITNPNKSYMTLCGTWVTNRNCWMGHGHVVGTLLRAWFSCFRAHVHVTLFVWTHALVCSLMDDVLQTHAAAQPLTQSINSGNSLFR